MAKGKGRALDASVPLLAVNSDDQLDEEKVDDFFDDADATTRLHDRRANGRPISYKRRRRRRGFCVCAAALSVVLVLSTWIGVSESGRTLVASKVAEAAQYAHSIVAGPPPSKAEPPDDLARPVPSRFAEPIALPPSATTSSTSETSSSASSPSPRPVLHALPSSAPSSSTPPPKPSADSDRILEDDRPRIAFSGATLDALNREACGEPTCRFLVAARTDEQETKAQQHLAQMALLAKRLDRVLVLPNVKAGRYAVCRSHPYDFYHDPAAFPALFNITAMQWPDFIAYSARRAELESVPNAQMVLVGHEAVEGAHTYRKFFSDPNRLCAGQATLDFSDRQGVDTAPSADSFVLESGRYGYGNWMATTLNSPAFFRSTSKSKSSKAPDVFFVRWHASMDIFAVPGSKTDELNASIPFHPRWRHLVDGMAAKLGPFVALHWRQEAITKGSKKLPDFVKCARQAEKQVERLDVSSVYFMTDFPLEGGDYYHSDSYWKYLQSHPAYRKIAQAGIDHLVAYFAKAPKYTFTTLFDEKPAVTYSNGTSVLVRDLDVGLNGILDKLMAERAAHYLVGEPYVCGRHSSYALQIVVERLRLSEQATSAVRSVVDYFPRVGVHRFETSISGMA